MAAEESPDISTCRGQYTTGEAECTLTYVGPVTAVGAYGTAVVTLEVVDKATGTRRVLDTCAADGGGCIAGHRTTGLDVPIGTQLYCHVRGTDATAASVVNRPELGATEASNEGQQSPVFACGTFTAAYADSAKDHLYI